MKMGNPRKTVSPEEKLERAVSARRKFRAIGKLIIANLNWLQDVEDEKLGDNVKKNIAVLTRKKGKKSLLTLKDKIILNKPSCDRTDEEKAHLRRIVGHLKCFRRYPPEVKAELPNILYFSFFGPNRLVLKQGYEAQNLYVILTGEVIVSQTYYDRLLRQQVTKDVLIMGPGNIFGEVALLHQTQRTASVTTTQPSEFLIVKRDDFDRVLKDTIARQWAECIENMSWFSYFEGWSEKNVMEACILSKKKQFQPQQIVLSSTGGQKDCVYFITHGSCYLLEYLTIRTVYKNGFPHYQLVKDGDEVDTRPPATVYRDIKKLYERKESQISVGKVKSSLRPAINATGPAFRPFSCSLPNIQVYFMRVCTFRKLACFNVGESLVNRVVVANTETECLLLPRNFLSEKSLLSFSTVKSFLNRHIPTTEKIFKNFLEERKWTLYKQGLVKEIVENRKAINNNNIHNVPYTIRLKEDLGEI